MRRQGAATECTFKGGLHFPSVRMFELDFAALRFALVNYEVNGALFCSIYMLG
jgi:hypothetical protein